MWRLSIHCMFVKIILSMKTRYGEKRYQIRQGSKNTFEKKAKQLKILFSGEATSMSLKSAVRENVTFRLKHQIQILLTLVYLTGDRTPYIPYVKRARKPLHHRKERNQPMSWRVIRNQPMLWRMVISVTWHYKISTEWRNIQLVDK